MYPSRCKDNSQDECTSENVLYLIHELACVEAEAIEEHLFAEDVHLLNSDEQGNCAGANDGAGPGTNQ